MSWPEAELVPSVHASLIVASPGFVFQLTPHDQVISPLPSAVFCERSFEVDTLPLGHVTLIVHCADGAVFIFILAVCRCATGVVRESTVMPSSLGITGVDVGVSVGVMGGAAVGVDVASGVRGVGVGVFVDAGVGVGVFVGDGTTVGVYEINGTKIFAGCADGFAAAAGLDDFDFAEAVDTYAPDVGATTVESLCRG